MTLMKKTVKKTAKKSAKKKPVKSKAKKSARSRAPSAARRPSSPIRARGGTVTLTHETSPPPYGRLLAVATPTSPYEVNTSRPAELFEVGSGGVETPLGNMASCTCPSGHPTTTKCYERTLSSNPSGKDFRAKVWFVHHDQDYGDASP